MQMCRFTGSAPLSDMAGGPFIRPLVPRSRRFAAPLAGASDKPCSGCNGAPRQSLTESLTAGNFLGFGDIEPIRTVASSSTAIATVNLSHHNQDGAYPPVQYYVYSGNVCEDQRRKKVGRRTQSDGGRASQSGDATTWRVPKVVSRSNQQCGRSRSRTVAVQTDTETDQLGSSVEVAVQFADARRSDPFADTTVEDATYLGPCDARVDGVPAKAMQLASQQLQTKAREIAVTGKPQSAADASTLDQRSEGKASERSFRLQKSEPSTASPGQNHSIQSTHPPLKRRPKSRPNLVHARSNDARPHIKHTDRGMSAPQRVRRVPQGVARGQDATGRSALASRRIITLSSFLPPSQESLSGRTDQSHRKENAVLPDLLDPLLSAGSYMGYVSSAGGDALLVPGLDAATLELEKLISDTHNTLVADGFLDGNTREPVTTLGSTHTASRNAISVLAPSSLDLVDRALEELQLGLEEIDRVLDGSNSATSVAAA